MQPRSTPLRSGGGAPGIPATDAAAVRTHLRAGWALVGVFAALGLLLEALHGFKVPWYVDASASTRRLLWTLAHAHGLLLGLTNIAYGCTLAALPGLHLPRGCSRALLTAALMLPLGFFAAGIVTYAGDPGLPILMVPVGAVLLLWAVTAIIHALRSTARATP